MANPKGNPESIAPYRFRPGQSGNPGGRPKKQPITSEYEKLSDKTLPEKLRNILNDQCGEELLPEGSTFAQGNAVRRYLDALEKGDTSAAREIREAIEGKSKVRVEVSGPEGGPVETVYSELSDQQLEERRRKMQAVIDAPAIAQGIAEAEADEHSEPDEHAEPEKSSAE